MLPFIRRHLLRFAGELAVMALSQTLRDKRSAVFAVIDAKLRHAYQHGDNGQTVESMIRQSVFEVTRKRATDSDLAALITLFDPTRLPGR